MAVVLTGLVLLLTTWAPHHLGSSLLPCRRLPAAAACRLRACAIAGGELEGTPFWERFVEAAQEEAADMGIELAGTRFEQGKLKVFARGGIDELGELTQRLGSVLDEEEEDETLDALPPFVLLVSSPGVSSNLQSDADFAAFKGFDVTVTTTEEFKKKTSFAGSLLGRDDEDVLLNLKGRTIKIPRPIVESVRLPNAKSEAGDVAPV